MNKKFGPVVAYSIWSAIEASNVVARDHSIESTFEPSITTVWNGFEEKTRAKVKGDEKRC